MHKSASLPPEILRIVRDKATEYPFTGKYEKSEQPGTYLCRQCGLALFRSQTKFHSGCGWPSFDEEIKDAVQMVPDTDGMRLEIICSRCHGHLGHVFKGENFTGKNTRYCVNSASLDFIADLTVTDTEEAIVGAGCFWGVEALFKKLPGVLKTEVGYSGGHKNHPSYEEICRKNTGHQEVLRVVYDKDKLSYEEVVKYFFEIHDPLQTDGQGPDLGEQYLSVIFYYDDAQKKIAEKVIQELENKDLPIATKILPVPIFWAAEEYHQDYYAKTGKTPYCHFYTKRF